MSLDTVNAIIQAVANIAVIASLLFVAAQVRTGVDMLRDAAMRNHNEKHQSISRALFDNAQLADLWSRGSRNGLSALTDGERMQFMSFYMYCLRVWEELFLQHRRGVMDKAQWAAHVRVLRDMYLLPGSQEAWRQRRYLFTDEFREFYETFGSGGASAPNPERTGAQ
jgi:hypothetical protein